MRARSYTPTSAFSFKYVSGNNNSTAKVLAICSILSEFMLMVYVFSHCVFSCGVQNACPSSWAQTKRSICEGVVALSINMNFSRLYFM